MKWSHAELGRTLLDLRRYAQGHNVKVGAICALAAAGVIAYGAATHSLSPARTLLTSDGYRIIEPLETKGPRSQAQPVMQTPSAIEVSPASSTEGASEGAVSGSVQVDGVVIPIPTNGEVHRQVQSADGTVSVDMSVSSSGADSSSSTQQTTLNINVQSEESTHYDSEGS